MADPNAAYAASHVGFLLPPLLFLGAAVVAVPLFRRLGLSAVLGYLVAGVVIGPSGLGLFADPGALTGVAELGVVMFLFIVGLELKPARLLAMGRAIAGFGAGQMVLSAAVIGGALWLGGLRPPLALLAGVALALSATSIALQMTEERGLTGTPAGERALAVLLFQDMATVAVLALLPLLAGTGGTDLREGASAVAVAALALGVVVLAGRYLLNPAFRLLARFGGREVMTAAALLVVIGAAVLMGVVGVSMALGAFLAGLLLAESDFRHQLEADIEPFRGLLLGLFFLSVGMTIDGPAVLARWPLMLGGTLALVAVKLAVAYGVLRLGGAERATALTAASLLTPAGEFAFVLLPGAVALRLATPQEASLLAALAALTMLAGPLVARGLEGVARVRAARAPKPPEPEESYEGAGGEVLVVGFGRFGQVVNQVLLADGRDVTVIDRNVESIRTAARFGFKVYYGDGARLDVLRAAGAAGAKLICVCVDGREDALAIVERVHHAFPGARTFVRAYDRVHAIDLMNRHADEVLRETFETALCFGRMAIEALGRSEPEAQATATDVRKRDVARLVMQQHEGLMGGQDLLRGGRVTPQPLTAPRHRAKPLSKETRDLVADVEEREREGDHAR